MSEPTPASKSASHRAASAIRFALPLALLAIGYAVLVSEQWSVSHELQLVAPEEVRPGDPIPVRAFVFGSVEHSEGGELVAAHVTVELRADSTALSRLSLRPSVQSTSEGNLPAVTDQRTLLQLVGVARNEEGEIIATAMRPLAITANARPLPLRGRIGLALQHLDLGPVMMEMAGDAAPSFDVRVAGGTCVPEEPCELWIDAAPADQVTIEDTPQASIVQRSSVDQGLIHFVIVPHGPEVAIELLASRLGQPMARRTVRLPIALATPWLSAPRMSRGFEIDTEVHAPPGSDQLILDVFHDGSWIHTETTNPGRTLVSVPDSGPGLYLLQVRADPYGGERVAARYVLVSPTASFEHTRSWLDQAGVHLADPPDTDPRMLLAGAEEEVRTLPVAASGLDADRARVQERRHRLHVIAAVALGVGIFVFVLLLLRRGFGAAAEAQTVMQEAGDSEAKSRRNRLRMTLSVLAIVGGVALALLAGAAILLARAAMIEW
jgi:hypothetical protein